MKKIIEGDVEVTSLDLKKLLDLSDVEVKGDFDCRDNNLNSLEGAPHTVVNFSCSYNPLINLEGSPHIVRGRFLCRENGLTSLKGSPLTIETNFTCSTNRLINLEGGPQTVIGTFECSYNRLISLKGAPNTVATGSIMDTSPGMDFYTWDSTFYCNAFICSNNLLPNLNGAPTTVGGSFDCQQNKLISLEGAPRMVGDKMGGSSIIPGGRAKLTHSVFNCSYNFLRDLKGAPNKVIGDFVCNNNPLISIEGLPKIITNNLILPAELENKFSEKYVRSLCDVKEIKYSNAYF